MAVIKDRTPRTRRPRAKVQPNNDYVQLEPKTVEELEVEQRRIKDDRILAFYHSISKKRTDAINARASSGVETRWLEDIAAYHGYDSISASRAEPEKLSTVRNTRASRRKSTQYVQKTRQKTNSGSARLSDMLLPTDDRNWEYDPTPVPELMEAIKNGHDQLFKDPTTGEPLEHPDNPETPEPEVDQNGQPIPVLDAHGQPVVNPQTGEPEMKMKAPRMLTMADMAAETERVARERCKAMQREVDDQLTECQANGEFRKAIDDAAQLGTGILRGPVPMNRVKKRWSPRKDENGKVYFDLEIEEETRPTTNRVDPWNAFPAPGCGDDPKKGGFFFEREIMPASGLKDLARLEDSGYDPQAIIECLKEDPKRAREAGLPERAYGADDNNVKNKSNYEIWNYWGEADPEDLAALGVNLEDNPGLRLKSIACVVTICNDRIIRAVVNPQSKGEIPYDFFQWEKVNGSPWGVGIPFLMRYAQKAMNAAWRQMQDNAGISHGPQIVMRKESLLPANEEWELHGMKAWYITDDSDPRMVFAVHNIPSNTAELQAIFAMASQLADDETSLPQLLQGVGAPDKVGVAVMQQNNANVVLKRFARNWDDQITGPHLRRYYDWNMEFNPKEEIKGDFMVKARGSTHLVVRDIRNQELQLIMQLRAADPDFRAWVNPEKLVKKYLEATSVGDIMFSDSEKRANDEKAAQQQPPVDPAIEVAKIRAAAAVKEAEVENQGEQANIAMNAEEAVRNDEREMSKLAYNLELKEMEAKMLMLKFAHERGLQLNDVKAQMAGKMLEIRSKAQMDRANRQMAGRAAKTVGQMPRPPKSNAPAQLATRRPQ